MFELSKYEEKSVRIKLPICWFECLVGWLFHHRNAFLRREWNFWNDYRFLRWEAVLDIYEYGIACMLTKKVSQYIGYIAGNVYHHSMSNCINLGSDHFGQRGGSSKLTMKVTSRITFRFERFEKGLAIGSNYSAPISKRSLCGVKTIFKDVEVNLCRSFVAVHPKCAASSSNP